MDLVSILIALGGFELVRWSVTSFINRKTNSRKEKASADSLEKENERKHIDWLETRLAQRDAKIDALYNEVRIIQSEKQNLIHEKHKTELDLKEATIRRCDVRGCSNRKPPTNF